MRAMLIAPAFKLIESSTVSAAVFYLLNPAVLLFVCFSTAAQGREWLLELFSPYYSSRSKDGQLLSLWALALEWPTVIANMTLPIPTSSTANAYRRQRHLVHLRLPQHSTRWTKQ
eukprot:Opistho-2@62463